MKNILLLLILVLSLPVMAVSGGGDKPSAPTDLIVTDINRVYDGDTFFIDVDEWPTIIGDDIGIRIVGIDTPEIRSRCKNKEAKANEKKLAIAARDYAKYLLDNANKIELRGMKRGSRFRIVASVYLDNENFAELMVNAGYGRAYDGKKKRKGWCFSGGGAEQGRKP